MGKKIIAIEDFIDKEKSVLKSKTKRLTFPLSDEDKKAWETYRQQLRDLPDNTKDFFNPEWPIKPGA